jgi:signal transduction histidine kinase
MQPNLEGFFQIDEDEEMTNFEALKSWPGGALVLSQKAEIVFANGEAERIFGTSLQGKSFLSLLDEKDLDTQQLLRMSSGQQIWVQSAEALVRPCFVKITEDQGQLLVAVQDLSQIHLDECTQDKKDWSVIFGEMAGTLAHDIASPATIIQTRASLLRKMSERGAVTAEDIAKTTDTIVKFTEKITNLMRKYRLRLKHGFGEESEVMDPTVIFDLALKNLRRRHPELYKLVRRGRITAKGQVKASRETFAEVLRNLIQNGAEAALQNKAKENPWVKVDIDQVGNEIVFSVTNSGPRLPEEQKERVFDLFFSTKPHAERDSLGLSVSKAILTKQSGQLEIGSDKAHTQFVMSLPIYEVEPVQE